MKTGNASAVMRLGFRIIRRRRVPARRPGAALDVGCGSGFYLAMLRDMGWTVTGIDASAEAARHARTLNGLDVRVGCAEVTLPELADESFDLVTLWHVLEHLYDPARVLAHIRRLLKPGGLLMLEVPNFSSVCSRLFQSYWAPLESPRHLFQFTPKTLKALLQKNGFQVDRVRGIASPQNLCASVNLAAQQWRGRPSSLTSVYGSLPVVMAAAFPAEWMLAHARLSCELSAVARRAD
jgi:SAM-dependent methyltransferase